MYEPLRGDLVAEKATASRYVVAKDSEAKGEVFLAGVQVTVRWDRDVLGRTLAKPWETWTFPDAEQAAKAFHRFEA